MTATPCRVNEPVPLWVMPCEELVVSRTKLPVMVVLPLPVEPIGGTAEDFGKLAQADSAKYARLVKELGIKTTSN